MASLRTVVNSSPHAQPERRRAVRALADFPIQLAPQAESKPARLRDISEIGLACTFGEQLEEMMLVAIDLSLPGQSQKHRVQGAVVRCEPMPAKKGQYDVAIFFTDVPASTRAALRNYVAKAKPAP